LFLVKKSCVRFVALLTLGLGAVAFASPTGSAGVPRDLGALCVQSVQWTTPEACPAYGPAAQREAYWTNGLLPRRPFPAGSLDDSWGALDRSYASVNSTYALPVFKTLDAAIRNNADHHLAKGFVYISYTQTIKRKDYNQEDREYLETGGGWFVHREDVTFSHVTENQFHGVFITAPPPRPFGWVVDQNGAAARSSPGQAAGEDSVRIPYYGFVEVFASQTIGGVAWYETGLGEWLPENQLGLIFPETTVPAGVPAGTRWISVDLAEQTLSAYEGDRMVFATLASTGVNKFWTRPGLFQIKKKWDMQSMSGSNPNYYFVQDVPFVMYFSSARAIHGSYWHNAFGYPRSHGCVNLPVVDAHWMYTFASEGTWVYVFDPTGKTPTDDASYQEGDAAP
jgi:hypothetical protein